MGLRVTQSQLYGRFTANMNNSLSSLIETNMQSSTQLKVNRPSDDPSTAGLIISSKATIDRLNYYTENLNAAKGWLSVSDSVLSSNGSVMNILDSIQTLAVQASTGSYTKEQRLQIGEEIRQYMHQLVNLANSKYGEKHIFGGQKTGNPPYSMGLGVSSSDQNTSVEAHTNASFTTSGSFKADYTIEVLGKDNGPPASVTYQYSYPDPSDTNVPPKNIVSDPIKALVNKDGKAELAVPGGNVTINKVDDLAVGDSFAIVEPKVSGSTEKTIVIQAEQTGKASEVSYRYSADGGFTWQEGVLPTKDANGNAVITTNTGVSLTINGEAQVNAVESTESSEADGGSWFYVRPTAMYKGDDDDTQVVLGYGNTTDVRTEAQGFFSRDVTVKIVSASPTEVVYAYSSDDGSTWTQGSSSVSNNETRLSIPGGFLSLKGDDIEQMQAGEQFTVHPHRASININISDNDSVAVNLVGKDIFGGQYVDPETGQVYTVPGEGNLFDVVGKLIGYCETGNQSGIQNCLDPLKKVMEGVTTQAAIVGGRWNRVEITLGQAENRIFDETGRLSEMQDVDVSELMIRLSQQQIAYNSVLKSSSMIMQMSLVNFL